LNRNVAETRPRQTSAVQHSRALGRSPRALLARRSRPRCDVTRPSASRAVSRGRVASNFCTSRSEFERSASTLFTRRLQTPLKRTTLQNIHNLAFPSLKSIVYRIFLFSAKYTREGFYTRKRFVLDRIRSFSPAFALFETRTRFSSSSNSFLTTFARLRNPRTEFDTLRDHVFNTQISLKQLSEAVTPAFL
jgi:hypothetical protein